jgi:hypothetical protein
MNNFNEDKNKSRDSWKGRANDINSTYTYTSGGVSSGNGNGSGNNFNMPSGYTSGSSYMRNNNI